MYHDCIDLTSDDDEKREIEDHRHNQLFEKSSRSFEVHECLSNSRTLNIIQSYRNNDSSYQLPTIINVQSLAPQNRTTCSKTMTASNILATPKTVVNKDKKSVFNKQKIERPNSSTASIVESIESCILKHSLSDSEHFKATKRLINDEVNMLVLTSANPYSEHETLKTEAPTPCSSKTKLLGTDERPILVSNNTKLFREFLCKCVSLEENEKDRLRADQKLRSSHEKASLEYKESEAFANLINKQLGNINKNNLYECLKLILDELKASRNIIDVEPNDSENTAESLALDRKTEANVIKLSKNLEKLNKKIKKIEETEVDLNDEDDEESAYILLDRYRERFTKIYKKICELTGNSVYSERIAKKKIRFNVTKYSDVNKVIERWLNKKNVFPDFSDVIQILKNTNLNLKPDQLHYLAEEVFREIGKLLQTRRKQDLWYSLSAFDSPDADPANNDANLNAILIQNRKTFKAKEEELINMFARKQLEGGDGECSTGAAHDSENDSEECSDSLELKNNINDNSLEAEEDVSHTGEEDEGDACKELVNEQECDINEENTWPPSSPRTPLIEMLNAGVVGDEVKTYSNGQSPSLKRRQSDDKKVISIKRICPITISDQLPNTSPKTDLNRSKNNLPTRPFGSVGRVIELNYLSVENLNKNVMSSIFRDCTNIIHRRPKSLSSAIKQISDKYEISRKSLFPSKPNSDSSLPESKLLYKSHGAGGHGSSSKENVPNKKENCSSTENQTIDKSTGGVGITGSDGFGDDDKDKDKKNNSKVENDLSDDAEETDDGDCEPDTTVDSSALADNQTENYVTKKEIENVTENERVIEKECEMNEAHAETEINQNSNDRLDDSNCPRLSEKGDGIDNIKLVTETDTDLKDLQESLTSKKDVCEAHISENTKVLGNLIESNQEVSSLLESCQEKGTEPDSQQSVPSKKSHKPAWIDNGEESDMDSDSTPKEKDKIIEASPTCLSEKVVTSTSSLKTVKGGKKRKLSKKVINKRRKLDRRAKSASSTNTSINEAGLEGDETTNKDLEISKETIIPSDVINKIEAQVNEDTSNDIEVISETIVKKPVLSEDERVKRFLETAKNSLSITVTRKRAMSKETMDAVNQLKKLKNVSATRVAPSFRVNRQAGPSRVHEPSIILNPYVGTPQPVHSPFSNQLRARPRFPNSPLNRLMISNVRGSGHRINSSPNYRGRNVLPVISNVQSFNRSTPIITSVRGNRVGPVRMYTPRGHPVMRGPAITPASQSRGRGAGRGNRIVPIVVLD